MTSHSCCCSRCQCLDKMLRSFICSLLEYIHIKIHKQDGKLSASTLSLTIIYLYTQYFVYIFNFSFVAHFHYYYDYLSVVIFLLVRTVLSILFAWIIACCSFAFIFRFNIDKKSVIASSITHNSHLSRYHRVLVGIFRSVVFFRVSVFEQSRKSVIVTTRF